MNIHSEIYQMIIDLVYGGTANAYGEYVAELFSTGAVLFLLSLPFILIWRIIKIFI